MSCSTAGAELVLSEKTVRCEVRPRSASLLYAVARAGDTTYNEVRSAGRQYSASLNALATIGEAGANFKSLGDPWADTTTPHGRLMLTVLGGLAEEKTVRCEVRPRSASLLLRSLEPGDTVLITKLDRPARSTRGSLNALATIGEAGANFKSLGDPWADTTTPHGRLMLTVLGGLAEFERHLILTDQEEGSEPRLAVSGSAGSPSSPRISKQTRWRGWRGARR